MRLKISQFRVRVANCGRDKDTHDYSVQKDRNGLILMYKAFRQIRDACVEEKWHEEFQYDLACLLLESLHLSSENYKPEVFWHDVLGVQSRLLRWDTKRIDKTLVCHRRIRLSNSKKKQNTHRLWRSGKWEQQ